MTMPKTKKPGIHLYRTEHYTGSVDYTWHWHIVSKNGRIIARSSETYTRKSGAVKSIKIVAQLFYFQFQDNGRLGYYDHSKKDSPLISYL